MYSSEGASFSGSLGRALGLPSGRATLELLASRPNGCLPLLEEMGQHQVALHASAKVKRSPLTLFVLVVSLGTALADREPRSRPFWGKSENTWGKPNMGKPNTATTSLKKKEECPMRNLNMACLACVPQDGTDEKFVEQLVAYHGAHPRFAECGPQTGWKVNATSTSERHFGVRHFGGAVIYDSAGFVEQNLTEVSEEAT